MNENGLSEVLSQLKKLDTRLDGIAAAQQRLEAAQQRFETAQQRLEATQQRMETGQQDVWAALNAHARRTSVRFDEIESSVDKGFARVQGQVQELLTRIERQDERSDRLGRRVAELEMPKPEPR